MPLADPSPTEISLVQEALAHLTVPVAVLSLGGRVLAANDPFCRCVSGLTVGADSLFEITRLSQEEWNRVSSTFVCDWELVTNSGSRYKAESKRVDSVYWLTLQPSPGGTNRHWKADPTVPEASGPGIHPLRGPIRSIWKSNEMPGLVDGAADRPYSKSGTGNQYKKEHCLVSDLLESTSTGPFTVQSDDGLTIYANPKMALLFFQILFQHVLLPLGTTATKTASINGAPDGVLIRTFGARLHPAAERIFNSFAPRSVETSAGTGELVTLRRLLDRMGASLVVISSTHEDACLKFVGTDPS